MVHKLGGAITYIYIDSLKETTKSKKRKLDLIKMPSSLNTSHSAPSFWLQCWKVKNRTTMKSWKESESFNHKVAHVFQIIDDLRRIFHFHTVCNISQYWYQICWNIHERAEMSSVPQQSFADPPCTMQLFNFTLLCLLHVSSADSIFSLFPVCA